MRMSGHRPTRRPGAQTQAESHLNPLGRSSGVPSAGYWIFDPQALQATLESLSPRWFGRHSGWQRLAQSTHASQQYLPDSGNMWFIRSIHQLQKDPDRLMKATRNSSFKQQKAQEQARGFVEKHEASRSFFRQGTSNQWRELLTDAQVERVVERHRVQMERFKYLP
jgi:hypothetical protein